MKTIQFYTTLNRGEGREAMKTSKVLTFPRVLSMIVAQEFGVTHVHALDGCGRMVLGFITIPKKNPVLIYQYLFR